MTALNRKTVTPALSKGSDMNNHSIKRNACRGVTLLELLFVVVIVAILTAIAYPSYLNTVYKGRRSDGQQALMNAVNRQEQYFLDHNTYGTAANARISATSSEGYYNIAVTSLNVAGCGGPPCYLITATAVAPQDGDAACTTLTISSNGTKGSTGTGTVADCW